jgi:hypothetical protein
MPIADATPAPRRDPLPPPLIQPDGGPGVRNGGGRKRSSFAPPLFDARFFWCQIMASKPSRINATSRAAPVRLIVAADSFDFGGRRQQVHDGVEFSRLRRQSALCSRR